jgi:hypothetical protein
MKRREQFLFAWEIYREKEVQSLWALMSLWDINRKKQK